MYNFNYGCKIQSALQAFLEIVIFFIGRKIWFKFGLMNSVPVPYSMFLCMNLSCTTSYLLCICRVEYVSSELMALLFYIYCSTVRKNRSYWQYFESRLCEKISSWLLLWRASESSIWFVRKYVMKQMCILLL